MGSWPKEGSSESPGFRNMLVQLLRARNGDISRAWVLHGRWFMDRIYRFFHRTRGHVSLVVSIGRISVLLVVSVFIGTLTGWPQDTASIVGTVTDSSGAVVPGARVSVSNPEKGFVRDVASNSAGEYTAAKIPIGNYVITAGAPGFEKLEHSGITLTAGQTQRVDLTLTVGSVTQQVQVSGNVARVETESAAISDVVTSKQIENLNLNGLNFGALTFLVPGAVQNNGYNPTQLGHNGAEIGVTFNGGRTEYGNLELDGGANSDEGSTSMGGAVIPALDSIAEFRVSTANYGADVGQHAGALVEVATKSGTKQFHGDAYEFVRNDVMDANDWFINQQIAPPGGNAPKTPLKWNTFGYTLGGPFYIPDHYNTSKTKTFFFWSQEWARYRQGQVISGDVPTSLMREGDFSQCDPASGNYSSYISGQGCALPIVNGQTVDSVAVNPNAAALLNAYVPLPNNGIDGYVSAKSVPTNFSDIMIRVDQNISDKASLFVRYTKDSWDNVAVPSLWMGSSYDTTQTDYQVPASQDVIHFAYNFKPNLMNEFIMSENNKPHNITPEPGPGSPAHSVDKPSAWTAGNMFPANAANPLLPAVSVSGGVPFGGFYVDSGNYNGANYTNEPVFTLKDNAAWTAGRHTVKVGFYLEKFFLGYTSGFDPQGSYSFFTGSANSTGNSLADMYLGLIGTYTEGTRNVGGVPIGGINRGHFRATYFQPYVQDDWKVSRRLTLNFGVRYYLNTNMSDVSNPTVDSNFMPSLYNPAVAAVLGADGFLHPNPATGQVEEYTTYGNGLVECGSGGIPKGCVKPSYKNIGPRFGFAYDPTGSGKTAIRGGYGLYYDSGDGDDANTQGIWNASPNPPATLAPTAYNVIGYQNFVPGLYGPANIYALPYNFKYPSIQQFNLNVQHEFRGNNLLTVGYVGTLGRHLSTTRNMNQIPVGTRTMNVPALAGFTAPDSLNPSNTTPMCDALGNCDVQRILINTALPTVYFVPYQDYGTINTLQYTAVSSYNAFQANFRHTTGHGLTLQTSYTWSHALDNGSDYWANGAMSVDENYDLSRWKGTSDLNRTQVLMMNYVYDLPFFKNAANGFLRQALGGWRVSGITAFFTGAPMDFNCGVSGFASGIGTPVRCNTVGPLKIKKGVVNDPEFGPMVTWFDPSAITQPLASQLYANGEPGMFGYMGRNVLTAPGRNNWDLALHKDIRFPWFTSEHSTLQFRLETFNTFNHPQWQSINAGCAGTISFGQPCTQTGNAEVSSAWAPRNVQLGMKFIF